MTEALLNYPLIFGLFAAILHVISGPDHLAAVGPIAINAKYRPWLIGMSWGVGHTVGMLLLGLLFFLFRDFIPLEFISANSEKIVGILLIAIGIWALYRAINYRRDNHSHAHIHTTVDGNSFIHNHSHLHVDSSKHSHGIAQEKQSYIAAASIGIIHGFAGISHIASMLPTIAFNSNYQAIQYLIGFGVGTIAAMVIFSFLLGLLGKTASKQKKDIVFIGINAVAGISAIFVGIFWMMHTW